MMDNMQISKGIIPSNLAQRTFLGPTLLSWLLVTPLVMIVAWVITSQFLLYMGWQKATWLSIEINASNDEAPPLISKLPIMEIL